MGKILIKQDLGIVQERVYVMSWGIAPLMFRNIILLITTSIVKHSSLSVMCMHTLKDSMKRDIVIVSPDDSVKKAADMMASKGIGCVISVEGNKPLGIITERDIVRKVVHKERNPDKTLVRDVMSRKIISLDSGRSIQEAVDTLEKKRIKKLPIIEHDKLIGIVTMTDLLISLGGIENEESENLKKLVKDLHLTKIKLQSRIVELEDRLSRSSEP